uniref:Uncharacterized protein n=1 Tax=Siphoviridae sp. ctdau33 TaxID=2827902 RepID=A0A8S5S6Z8_9CAUD|nr:MAG TPA: hypothetical protein [Siphoviridae sp. ctdau33]
MAITDGGPTMTMPVAPTGMMGGGFGGFGGENGWWVILFIILLFGWGRNGYGNSNGGVVDGYVLTSDFANVERKIESVNQGLCDGFYQQAQLVNGTNMAMANGFAQAELSRSNQQAALMQQLTAMQMQNQECCCENRAAIAQVRYDMATQACDTRNTVQTAARDIVENANANSRAILDFLTQSKLQDLQSANQELRLAASQAAQNNYLISQLRPTPIPSYPSCNPWASGSYTGCCGC